MTAPAHRPKVLVGSVVLLAGLLFLGSVVGSPSVAGPAARIARTMASALRAEREDDLLAVLDSLEGLRRGLPVFLVDAAGDARPIAHVVTWTADEADPSRGTVRLRFEPGEADPGPWRVVAYPPSRKLGAALDMAVPPEAARRFGRYVAGRLETLWAEALLPEAERRMPEFLARIDPTADTQARGLMQDVTRSILARLAPLLDDLGSDVVSAVKRKFDLLDRMGMLWKVLAGDAEGLRRQILPVAQEAAQAWWAGHQDPVLRAVGAGIREHLGALRDWAGGELFEAARAELVGPVLAAQRKRLEAEGERLLRRAADEFVEAPGGGFRVRFAGLLRTQVLDKDTALLLLRRAEPGP